MSPAAARYQQGPGCARRPAGLWDLVQHVPSVSPLWGFPAAPAPRGARPAPPAEGPPAEVEGHEAPAKGRSAERTEIERGTLNGGDCPNLSQLGLW